MKTRILLAASAAMLALSPVSTTLAAPAKSAATEVPSQLPRNAAPIHYSITVTPNAEKLSFEGNVRIEFLLKTPSDSITLNAADIDFRRVTVAKGRAAAMPATATVNAAAQTATIGFGKKLPAGRYTLNIDYSGKILQQANGLFALDYKDPQGAEKRALFTQFEAPDARRFVPSWDEPNYKATFDLSATVPSHQMAVSNMPVAARRDIGNGLAEVRFGTSPKMSTYLLFFGLGEFDRITKQVGPTEVGVVVGKGNGPKGQYALDASAKLVAYYNDYFDTPYPLPKLDNVAGPGQSQFFSAMENWGAIFTFERVLLNDPKITSARTRQGIFSTDAHEIAHQWFGNLVTMAWWDDLWLNEGFASWMESKATAHFNPDWQSELDRVNGREGAMGLDAYVTTHPVIQKITTVEQASQAFDTITYQKGEAVITMLEAYAGENVWRDGLRAYMKKHAYANTRTDDLWNAVEAAGAKGLVKIAHDFTKQPGVPLLEVKSAKCVNGSTLLTLSQSEFSRDRKAETAAKPQRWNVPVIAQVIGQAPGKTVISNGSGTLQLAGCGSFIVNAGQSGYYRVLYQPDMMAALQRDFAKLPAIDQLGLLNDSQSLAFNEYQPVRTALDLVDAVPSDTSQRVTEDNVATFGFLYGLFEKDAPRQAKLAKLASARFGPALAKLGFRQSPSDSTLDANLRSSLISTLGYMGDPAVVAEAKRLFAELETNPAALDGPLRTTWLGVIAQNANQADWDKMRKLGQTAESFLVKSSMYRLLGAARDTALAKQALDLALTKEPGPTLSAAIINGVSGDHPDLAVDFALANREAVEALVDVSSKSEFIPGLGYGSSDPAMIGKLEAYAKAYLSPESRKPVDQAIAAIQTRIKSQPRIRTETSAWLDEKVAQ
ncbi:M1 family metallopeptidase [Sphingorhabdus contaminans]|nr:M1 family metallopeptidase [Sphingorhabdus contaminans]